MSRGKQLTEEERQYIKVHCLDQSIQEIATALGRNYWTIHRVLQGMGVAKSHTFTADEDFLIRKLYGKFSAKYIATKIGVDETAIYNRVKKLGLKKNGV